MTNRLRSRFEKISASTAGVLLAATALNACSEDIPPSELDPSITSITLESGAQIREEPVVLDDQKDGMTNRLVKIGDDKVPINTPDGAQVASGDDGKWVGLDITLFPPDFYNSIKRDEDNIVWIKNQEVDLEYSTPAITVE